MVYYTIDMPAKKIDPTEKIQLEKRKNVKQKLMFASALAVLIALGNLAMFLRADSQPSKPKQESSQPEEEEVLSEASQREKTSLESVVKQSGELINTVSTQSDKVIGDTKANLSDKIDSVLYTTTIKPIIDKIESLPVAQQKHIEEAICKPH